MAAPIAQGMAAPDGGLSAPVVEGMAAPDGGLSAAAGGLAAPTRGLATTDMDDQVAPACGLAEPDAMSTVIALARSWLPTPPPPAVEYNLPVVELSFR